LYAEALSGAIFKKRARQKLFDYMELLKGIGLPPTDEQKATLISLKEKFDESLLDDAMAKNKGAALTFCQQIANGPGWIGEEGSSPKEDEFRRLVVDELASEKIIVFTRFESGIERLSSILKEEDVKFVRVSGKENGRQREEAMMAFQDPEGDTRVIFITTAGSAAINLQSASVLIFYDTPWSFGDLCQTIGRAQRIGSKHSSVLVIHMVTESTIDEHVLDVLSDKKWLTDQIMGDIALGALEFSKEVDFKEEQGDTDALFSKVFR
jgi:SNF2 family DNA or RNA helicase